MVGAGSSEILAIEVTFTETVSSVNATACHSARL